MKTPTPWGDNDIKLPSAWTGIAKTPAVYVNNVTKTPTVFTPVSKQNTLWGLEITVSEPWLYDDATQKYDDTPVRGYDYLVPVINQINGKLPATWAVVI